MSDAGFGIYVHWPFCLHKCPYCDFNSHVRQNFEYEIWRKAYINSILAQSEYRKGDALTSVYFGGGTPSTCPPSVIDSILNEISKHWSLESAEVTLEANPTSVESRSFQSFANSGINRVSIGFQAFNNIDLKRLGRMHTVKESIQSYEVAKKYFSRSNFDLIYARQFQTFENWQNELKDVLKLEPTHLSLYQLMIEENTRFSEMYKRGSLKGLPNESLAHDMYVWTRDFMRNHGFVHYEVSNFAIPGEESSHNLIYWKYGDYLGIGPGAHGRQKSNKNRVATSQVAYPENWLKQPTNFQRQILSNLETAEEYVLMGLRIEEGIEFSRLDNYGLKLPQKPLADLIEQGLLKQSNSHVRTTDKGRLLLNHVIERLLA